MGKSQNATCKSTEGEKVMTVKAVYQDRDGNRFSCPVVKVNGEWKLSTEVGIRAIEFYLMDDTAVDGVIAFCDFIIQPQERLRACDALNAINAVRASLPWPTQPAERPTVPTPDSRLHIEPRLPTQSSFAQLQIAAAEKMAEQRRQREAERAEMRNAPADQQAIDRSRKLNNAFAERIRPRRNQG